MASASVPSARRGSATHEDGHCDRSGSSHPVAGSLHNVSADAARRLQQAAVRRVVSGGGPEIVYQPQLSLSRMTVEGYEALARFPDSPIRGTEDWFTRARELGLGIALETSAVERALARRHERPAGTTIAVNVSPAVLTSPSFASVLPDDLTGVEIELTEHEWSPGTGPLRRSLDHLRERGARIAIDDVGTAHSGLRRVIDLSPDKLKLDRVLVQGVAHSSSKAALIRAVVDLAEQIGATVCAEGVENLDDLEAVADLDVASAQGWAIGMPESDFRDAEPGAVRSAEDRLVVMLSGGHRASLPPQTYAAQSPTVPIRVEAPTPATPAVPGSQPGASPIDLRSTPPVADVEELLTRLTTVTDLPALHSLVGGCGQVLGADSMVVSVLSADGATLAAAHHPGTFGETFPLTGYPLTQVCLSTRTVIPVYRGDEPVTDRAPGEQSECDLLHRTGFETVLMVPVISRDRVIGLLECYRRDDAPWSRRQIRSARTVAAMLGPVMDGLLT
ncbi:EAL domain-containing protein [Kineosporia succinea]|uniref:EAL domain-containing protein (Putative c-di-GMP-specific phosphodiesterase class I) n=1 Tax=Kineosporia succinea TaxID=84632 RepID=A0ABT9NW94_9ACTN|nr:EAL domain-containing protein [Kineosporia succinea]MDP9824691.1 EAL domain-containing protein (putative c-di-GMP-specific phosphodiesterase class I) [Kineosporia succinea]